jgi:hypothetical protein
MSRGHELKRTPVGGLILAGICLLSIAIFAPDGGQTHVGSFFKIATASSWHRFFDLNAAWCSVKIILLSIGLFLVIDSLGTILARLNYRHWAARIFTLQVVSCLGLLIGGYYFVKALF